MLDLKLGRLPAVNDTRVPFLSTLPAAKTLPPAPAWVNWYAGVESWGMLGNDRVGDCVQAAIGHAVTAFTNYADAPLVPTTAEALAFYSAATGYNPADPATDQGSVILGPGGVLPFWHTQGATFGGVLNRVSAFVRLHTGDFDHQLWRQAAHYFGGLLAGIDLPASILDGASVPYVWRDTSGPIAGGHCIWLCGYEWVKDELFWDLISWGARYRATDNFLRKTTREMVALYDTDALNARGLNPDDFDAAALVAAMQTLRTETA